MPRILKSIWGIFIGMVRWSGKILVFGDSQSVVRISLQGETLRFSAVVNFGRWICMRYLGSL